MLSMSAEIDQGIWATNRAWRESSMECGGTRGCHTRSNGRSFAALFAEPPSRASLHFSFMAETTFDCRGAWRKSSTLSCSRKDQTTCQLSPSVEKVAAGASVIRALCTKVQMAPEHGQRARTSLLCCWFGRTHFESHDTLIEGLRLHPKANGYAKRLLADAGFRP